MQQVEINAEHLRRTEQIMSTKPTKPTKPTGFTCQVLIMLAVTIFAVIVGVVYLKAASSGVGEPVEGKTIFDFTVDSGATSESVQLSDFKGKKAYLVINVASECGLTERNYAEMSQVYEKLRSVATSALNSTMIQ